jgi:hypothetical protein
MSSRVSNSSLSGFLRPIKRRKTVNRNVVSYPDFLDRKEHLTGGDGFDPSFLPSGLFDFQEALVEWALHRARCAMLADCGLGKSPMQLTWAQNIVERENGRVLDLTPLAVGAQMVREGEKFGIDVVRSRDGRNLPKSGVIITNYEQLEKFDPNDFVGVVCDESSCLKNFDGVRRGEITRFLSKMRYRLLCTATSAPNDYIELGTHSEALGELGYVDVLGRFFVTEDGRGSAAKRGWGEAVKFRLKGHAEEPFWRWVCSWARAVRKPSDLGFDDGRFVLPPLVENTHLVEARNIPKGMLFEVRADGLQAQREAGRRTLRERCEKVAQLCADHPMSLVWCNLNDEGDLLENVIDDAVQVSGSDPDEKKEERLLAFAEGQIKRLVTKPRIGGWGLNFQRCAHVTEFPTHSFEAHYQGIRRCWRFGQDRPVTVDIVGTEGLSGIIENLRRKSVAADKMFDQLVVSMNQSLAVREVRNVESMEIPTWIV